MRNCFEVRTTYTHNAHIEGVNFDSLDDAFAQYKLETSTPDPRYYKLVELVFQIWDDDDCELVVERVLEHERV